MLLKPTSFYIKIKSMLKSIKKRKKHFKTVCDYTSRSKTPISNNALILLLGLNEVRALQIISVSPNYNVEKVAKQFFNMLY